jgi:hypothetical protein
MIFLETFWKPISAALVALLLIGYISVLKHQKNAAVDALQAYKIQVAVVGKQAELKAAEVKAKQADVVTQTALAYNDTILRVRKYYDNKSKPAGTAYANGVQLNPTGSGSVPTVQEPAEVSASSGKDIDPAASGQSLEQSCAITTIQYNSLWNAWNDLCKVSGCE